MDLKRGRKIKLDRKAQFTIFVIIGIVLVAVFGFMFYVRALVVKSQLNTQVSSQINDFIAQSSMNTYVESCLEKVTQDALKKVGEQGGVLYVEGAPNKDYLPFNYSNTTYNVSYAIIPNYECLKIRQSPPDYPLENTFLENLPVIYSDSCKFIDSFAAFSGFFGLNNLTKLCDINGPNKVGPGGNKVLYQTCISGTYAPEINKSIQEQLEYYISEKLPNCTDFKIFENRFGANISVLNTTPNTTIIFGYSGLTVQTKYPFVLSVAGKQPVIRLVKFEKKINVPFKEIYNYMFYLLYAETNSVLFNITEYPGVPSYNAGYFVYKYENVNNTYNNIIQLQDNNTLIDGKPFIFQVAVKNRRPALQYIHISGSIDYDVVAIENDTIVLDPQGHDPDEDYLIYNYSLWKETYDEWFNYDCCNWPNVNCSDWKNASSNCIFKKYLPEPHNWTNSGLFTNTLRKASVVTNHSDIGLHNVSVIVWDKEHLMDWQIVKILVFDLPVARINGSSNYSDINGGFASVEDPYILNGTNSSVTMGGDLDSFMWNDTTQPFYNTSKNPILIVPWDPIGQHENLIDLIKPLNFTKENKTHNISLIVNATNPVRESLPAYLLLNVSQCLPHRNDNSASYPYNKTSDGFQGNHTCCQGITDAGNPRALTNWGKITTNTQQICFTNTSLRCYPDRTGNTIYYPATLALKFDTQTKKLISLTVSPTITGNDPDMNDIYQRTYTQNCDGNRGNACSGTASDLWNSIAACKDKSGTETESCEGPCDPHDSKCKKDDGCLNYNFGTPACHKYSPGDSFQANFTGGGNGVCDENTKCASLGPNGYITPGNFQCIATCNGLGFCKNTRTKDCIIKFGCGVATQSCDGIPANSVFPKDGHGCDAQSKYFIDVCYADGTARDKDKICKSPSSGIECQAIQQCDGTEQYHFKLNQGWCYGTEGCTSFCDKTRGEIWIDTNGDKKPNEGDTCSITCNGNNVCDSKFDGPPYGNCVMGRCSGD